MRILTSDDHQPAHARHRRSAADMVRPVYKAPIAPPPAPTWTGFYVGVNVGGAAAKSDLDFSIVGGPTFASIDNAFSGIARRWPDRLQLAVRIVRRRLRGGLPGQQPERIARCALYALRSAFRAGLSASYSQSVPWFGTARARLGYAQDSWLIYATGGYAYANLETNAIATAGPLSRASASARSGAAGPSAAASKSDSRRTGARKLEYLYADFGNVRTTWLAPTVPLLPPLPALNDDARLTMNVVRAGVNYRF